MKNNNYCLVQGNRCGYFEWCEAALCERAREVIPGLVARIKELERKMASKKMKETCSVGHRDCVCIGVVLAVVVLMCTIMFLC